MPPDHKGNTNRPQVVFFQGGDRDFSYMFLSSLKSERVTADSQRLLVFMDPAKSVSFFQPTKSRIELHSDGIDIPAMAFCSPDPRRYEECARMVESNSTCPAGNAMNYLLLGLTFAIMI